MYRILCISGYTHARGYVPGVFTKEDAENFVFARTALSRNGFTITYIIEEIAPVAAGNNVEGAIQSSPAMRNPRSAGPAS